MCKIYNTQVFILSKEVNYENNNFEAENTLKVRTAVITVPLILSLIAEYPKHSNISGFCHGRYFIYVGAFTIWTGYFGF